MATRKTPAKKNKAPAAKKAQPKAETKTEVKTEVKTPNSKNYGAGLLCLFGAFLHVIMGAEAGNGVGGFFFFSLNYFIIILIVQSAGLFWLYSVRTTATWLGFTILIFYLLDLYMNGQFLMRLHYSDLTMCEFTNNEPKYCSAAYGVSLAHIIVSSTMAILAIGLLVKLKILKKS